MSLPEQESRSLDEAFQFLLDLSSGAEKRIPAATRQRARAIVKHFPLAAGERWQACVTPPGTSRPDERERREPTNGSAGPGRDHG